MSAKFNPVRDIEDFHLKFEVHYEGLPRALPKDLEKFRNKFLGEELSEYMTAQTLAYDITTQSPDQRDKAEYAHQLEQALDGLVDLVYVAIGTAHLHGFDFEEAWRRVHHANMQKIRTPSAEASTRGSKHDVIKPEGWEPPSHTDLVEVNDVHMGHEDRS